MKNVLIFPAGTEVAFEIVNALKYSKFVKLYGGTSTKDHSEFIYQNLIEGFPYVDEVGFLPYLNRIIKEYSIDCIYPAHDSMCVFCSSHAKEIDTQVIVTEPTTTAICRSKKAIYDYLKAYDFIPHIYEGPDAVDRFPIFVKPAVGQGSAGAKKIANENELEQALKSPEEMVICEYLPGDEYTVDCFTDKDETLLISKLRDRQRIRAGIAVRSMTLETDNQIKMIASVLNERFHFKGAWFFQVKKDTGGKCKLLEVSPRIAGTMGLSRNLGINFPMLTLFVFWGYDVSLVENDYDIIVDRAFYSAYHISYEYDHIYLDFDDTLMIRGKVNSDFMRFIYQSVNKGKKLHLLSKHDGDLHADLKKAKISEDLFEDILVLPPGAEKKDYIMERSAIFIDDSFAERKKVKDATGIAVFDVDMVESLIDWRV